MCAVAAGFPALTDLGAGGTGITGVGVERWATATATALGGVSVLDLDANALTWGGAVAALGRLPRLRRLVLSNNGIRSLRQEGEAGDTTPPVGEPDGHGAATPAASVGNGAPACPPAPPPFPVLGYLNLTGNPFASYDDLAPLADLPALTALVLPPVPGLDPPRPPAAVALTSIPTATTATATSATAAAAAAAVDDADALAAAHMAQLLAALPRLTTLNGTALTADDRTTAERAYLRATAPAVVASAAAAATAGAAAAAAAPPAAKSPPPATPTAPHRGRSPSRWQRTRPPRPPQWHTRGAGRVPQRAR